MSYTFWPFLMSLVDHMPAPLCSARPTCQKCSSHSSGLLQCGHMEMTWHLCINFSWASPLDVPPTFEYRLFQRLSPADRPRHSRSVAEGFKCNVGLPCWRSNNMEVAHLVHHCRDALSFMSAINSFPIRLELFPVGWKLL